MKTILVYIGIGIVRFVGFFPLAVAQKLGRLLGRVLYLTKSKSARVTELNLAHCYPKLSAEEIKTLTKKSLKCHGETLLEVGMAWTWPLEKVISKIVQVEGMEYLQAALKADKGILLLAPHHGNWELLNHFFRQHLFMTVMYKPNKVKALDDFIFNTRKRVNVGLAPANRRGVGMIFKILKNNGVVAILPDQVPEASGGVYADLFGNPALTGKLASQIANKTTCTVLSCYAKRLSNGLYSVVINPAEKAIRDTCPVVSATAINQTVETCISGCPEQYQWSYKRFKNPLDSQKGIYRKS